MALFFFYCYYLLRFALMIYNLGDEEMYIVFIYLDFDESEQPTNKSRMK